MKPNYVILSEVSFEDNSYEIIINTPIGSFRGFTEPDEMDSKYPSSFHASEICLAKALRSYADAAINLTKREIKLLENMIKQSVDFATDRDDIDNNSFRVLNGTLKQKKAELAKWQTRYDNMTNDIKNRIAARDRIVLSYSKGENN